MPFSEVRSSAMMATSAPVLTANTLLREHSNRTSNTGHSSEVASKSHSMHINVAATKSNHATTATLSSSLPSFDPSGHESDADGDNDWSTAPNTPIILEENTLKQLQNLLSEDAFPTERNQHDSNNDTITPRAMPQSSLNRVATSNNKGINDTTSDGQHTFSSVNVCEECADPFSGIPQPCMRRRRNSNSNSNSNSSPFMTSSSSPSTTSTTTTTTSIDTLEHRATVSVKGQSPPLKTPVLHIPPQRVQSLPSAIRMNNPLLGSAHSPVAPLVKEPLPELPLSPRLRRSSSLDQVNNLQLDQLQRWIIGFCVVTFDLELGHAMELVYPSLGLDADLKQNISFCAFPDSHAVSLGDTVYSFRVRVDLTSTTSTTSGLGTTPLARCHSSGPAKPKLSLPDITDHDGFLYGYVLFRQRKDPHLRRGYFQKSLVLLSKQHLPGLYLEIVRRVGANYFTEGRHVLEHACVDIANWPKPSPGKTLLLPLLDAKLQVELPSRHRMQLLPRAAALNNPDQYLLASIAPAALYTHSREFLNDLWLCWELVLLGEPIMVLAKGTRECADTVLSLINLIAPIPYGGDWRPYFTVHDSDFKAYSSRLKTPGSVIVGVTNPFFKDAFDHWPNILRVNQADTTLSVSVPTRTPSPFERPSLKKFGRQGSGSSFDFIPGLTSKRKRTIDRDTALIKEITTLAQQRVSPHLLNDTIRKYFSELTERFLEPLDRYFATLIPTNSAELTTSQSPPSLKPFRQDEFLKFVQEKGTRLKFKTAAFQATACSDFYAQFLRCPNFVQWLQMRSVAAERRLRQTHLRALTDANLSIWMRHRTEVELVDMLMRIRYHLRTAVPIDQRPSDEQMDQLRAQAELIVNRLPADLKTMLTPAAPIC